MAGRSPEEASPWPDSVGASADGAVSEAGAVSGVPDGCASLSIPVSLWGVSGEDGAVSGAEESEEAVSGTASSTRSESARAPLSSMEEPSLAGGVSAMVSPS